MPADSTCPTLGLLLSRGQVSFDRPGNFAIVGELALTGHAPSIKSILAMACFLSRGHHTQFRRDQSLSVHRSDMVRPL